MRNDNSIFRSKKVAVCCGSFTFCEAASDFDTLSAAAYTSSPLITQSLHLSTTFTLVAIGGDVCFRGFSLSSSKC
jgi:hypothetical protein